MTKEERKVYMKAWKAKNADKDKASKDKWRASNKDHIKAYSEANKDKNAKVTREWKINNKEKQEAYLLRTRDERMADSKARREAKKTPFNIVYCIPDYDGKGGHYVGVTNQPHKRMQAHALKGKINTDNWFILDVVIDRGEALMSESRFHAQGYDGAGGWRDKK